MAKNFRKLIRALRIDKETKKLNSALTRLKFRVPYGSDMIVVAYFDTSDTPSLATFTSGHFDDSHFVLSVWRNCYSDKGDCARKYREQVKADIADYVDLLNKWNPDYLGSTGSIRVYELI